MHQVRADGLLLLHDRRPLHRLPPSVHLLVHPSPIRSQPDCLKKELAGNPPPSPPLARLTRSWTVSYAGGRSASRPDTAAATDTASSHFILVKIGRPASGCQTPKFQQAKIWRLNSRMLNLAAVKLAAASQPGYSLDLIFSIILAISQVSQLFHFERDSHVNRHRYTSTVSSYFFGKIGVRQTTLF